MDVNSSLKRTQNFTVSPNQTINCPELQPWEKMFSNYVNCGHGYLAAVVCMAGIMANLTNIFTLSRPKMVSPINYMLMMIAIAELLLMAFYLPTAVIFYILAEPGLPKLYTHSRTAARYLYFSMSFSVVCHSISIWHTIAVATFRWIMLGLPHGKQYITLKSAYIVSAIIVIASCCLSAPIWVTNSIISFHIENCHVITTAFTVTVIGYMDTQLYGLLFACFAKITPSVLLTILTIPLLVIMHKAEQRRRKLHSKGRSEESKRHQENNRTTGMLLAAVVIFLCIELPHGIVILFRYKVKVDTIYSAIGEIIDLVTLIMFTINLGLYTVMSKKFRSTFFSLFCRPANDLDKTTIRRFPAIITNLENTSRRIPRSRPKNHSQENGVAERMIDRRSLRAVSPPINESTRLPSRIDLSDVE